MRMLVIAIQMVRKNNSIRPTLNSVHGKYITLEIGGYGSHLPLHASKPILRKLMGYKAEDHLLNLMNRTNAN